MAKELYIDVSLGELEALPFGEVNLGVPLHNNSIQIGGDRRASDTRLIVATDEEFTTTISRLDGAPIQADTIANSGERLPVFTAPLDRLVVSPDMGPACETVWYARAGETALGINDMGLFAHFAMTVGYHAYSKAHGIAPIRQPIQYQKSVH